MAVNPLTVVDVVRGGVSSDETLVEPTVTFGDSFINDGKTFFHFINNSAGDITITITPVRTYDGQAVAAKVVTIKATADGDGLDSLFLGPYTKTFEQASGGTVIAICSAVTDMLVGAFRLP